MGGALPTWDLNRLGAAAHQLCHPGLVGETGRPPMLLAGRRYVQTCTPWRVVESGAHATKAARLHWKGPTAS